MWRAVGVLPCSQRQTVFTVGPASIPSTARESSRSFHATSLSE